nr:MAG: hypothetical protein 2 [Leviviridae sp.]
MAFTDPLSITISGTTTPLPRVSVEDETSQYQSSDGLIAVTASHQVAKRARRMLRLDVSKITSDPFKPSENVKVAYSHYLVFDVPPAGFTNTEILAGYTGFKTMYSASTDALITKLLGGES